LVLDLDPQATLTLFFGLMPDLDVAPEETITDTLIFNPQALRDVVLQTYFTGIDLVPANLALQDAEIALANPQTNNDKQLGSPVARLASALDMVEDDYDVIVFDCGPNLGLLTLNAAYAASGLIIPMQPAMADFGSSVLFCQTMATLLGDRRFDKPLEFLKVLITRHTGTAEAKNTEAMIRLAFGQDVLDNIMVQTVEIERAANDFGSVYEIQQPRGSAEAYGRAVSALHAVNGEIIEMFKRVWERQIRQKAPGPAGEVAHA
jgi:chromosome partitioning protein